MEIQQSFSIYNKFREEKEKYNKLFEKYGKSYDLIISYNKNTNSINYISNKGTVDEERLSVKYSSDGKIVDVFAYAGYAEVDENYKSWSSLTWQLTNLASNRYKRIFNNPFSIVAPPHVSSYKKEGMFDVMMQVTNEYIKQTDQNVTLVVSYEGYGTAYSPIAKIVHGKDMALSTDFYKKTEIYDPDILYAIKYYEDKKKDNIFVDHNNSEKGELEREEER